MRKLIRLIRKTGSEVQATNQGKVVALLVPVASPEGRASEQCDWVSIDILAVEIGARWPKGVSASQAVSESRRWCLGDVLRRMMWR
jgi:antitoxin (DNA-binding transcriptional repressor) of toxin-antitoxin stability system